MTPVQALAAHGQSIWLDYIRRDMTRSGELARMIEDVGVLGMTSNPSIFQKTIGGPDYHAVLAELGANEALDAKTVYERIAIEDIREACDAMAPLYRRCDGRDGFVSLEVAPNLALDAEGTVEEARRLYAAVDRPNLMIKVPATTAGLAAIETLIAEGISVNVTLIFSRARYGEVAAAHLRGLQRRAAQGGALAPVASVASFFVSRIDSAIDPMLEDLAKRDASRRDRALALRGTIAVANAKVAYAQYLEAMASPAWQAVAAKGARPQRLLWASTGTKNEAYRDVIYVEELVGPETVNTVPPATLDAFLDHGRAALTLTRDVPAANAALAELEALGISLDAVTAELLEAGLKQFSDAMNSLLSAIAAEQRRARERRP